MRRRRGGLKNEEHESRRGRKAKRPLVMTSALRPAASVIN